MGRFSSGMPHRLGGLFPIVCSVLVAVVLFSLALNIRLYLIASSSVPISANGSDTEPRIEPEPTDDAIIGIFDANDASGILVTNMSLVFSILYGFIFNRSYQRFDDVSRAFSTEVANLHQLVNLIRLVDFDVVAL